jgi:hypothetical protein
MDAFGGKLDPEACGKWCNSRKNKAVLPFPNVVPFTDPLLPQLLAHAAHPYRHGTAESPHEALRNSHPSDLTG